MTHRRVGQRACLVKSDQISASPFRKRIRVHQRHPVLEQPPVPNLPNQNHYGGDPRGRGIQQRVQKLPDMDSRAFVEDRSLDEVWDVYQDL